VRGRFFRPNRTLIRPWYERNAARLTADRALVAQFCPTLQFRLDKPTGKMVLEGGILIPEECGISTEIVTVIRFPGDYPGREPKAFDANRRFQAWPDRDWRDRHLRSDGLCCLWLSPRSPWTSTDPFALRHFLDQLAIFFDKQLIYDLTGKWTGPAYAHERDGFLEFIREELGGDSILTETLLPVITMHTTVGPNDGCPCGQPNKFKKCHLRIVERIQGRIGVETIRANFPREWATPK
jgi:hypothetical protein